jgi:hypothetical protein
MREQVCNVFISVILCRVGKRAAGSQNRMTIDIARLPTIFPATWNVGFGGQAAVRSGYDFDKSARLPTLQFYKIVNMDFIINISDFSLPLKCEIRYQGYSNFKWTSEPIPLLILRARNVLWPMKETPRKYGVNVPT